MNNPTKYQGNEIKYVTKVLEGETWGGSGLGRKGEQSWVGRLEEAFADRFNVDYAVAFNSGTATLHAALFALGVKPGDEVISPALTVIMDTTSTLHANAVPVYADVLPDTFTLDPKDVERKITKKTKAIIAVSLYGLPCEMDELKVISKKYYVPIIEDNAQCYLSTYKGEPIGAIGKIGSYSFENSKHLSCGEGGIIITNDESVAHMARKLGGHGFSALTAKGSDVKIDVDKFQHPSFKRHDELGWNYRLNEFSAAVALAQLERIDQLVQLRIDSAHALLEVIKDYDFFTPQAIPSYSTHSYFSLAVIYNKSGLGISWGRFRRAFIDNGGESLYGCWSVPYLEPLMTSGRFADYSPYSYYTNLKYEKGLCPVAESIQPNIMQFKTNYRTPTLAKRQGEILRKTITGFLNG